MTTLPLHAARILSAERLRSISVRYCIISYNVGTFYDLFLFTACCGCCYMYTCWHRTTPSYELRLCGLFIRYRFHTATFDLHSWNRQVAMRDGSGRMEVPGYAAAFTGAILHRYSLLLFYIPLWRRWRVLFPSFVPLPLYYFHIFYYVYYGIFCLSVRYLSTWILPHLSSFYFQCGYQPVSTAVVAFHNLPSPLFVAFGRTVAVVACFAVYLP
jgi:hypothetical protein